MERQWIPTTSIQCGIRQDCIFSQILLNLYAHKLFRVVLEDQSWRVFESERDWWNNHCYLPVCRQVTLVSKLEDLQYLLNRITEAGANLSLNINILTTKFIVALHLKSQERVLSIPQCRYDKTTGSGCRGKMQNRIALTNFLKLKLTLCNDILNLKLDNGWSNAISPLHFYLGFETWLRKFNNRMEAFEMWLHRIMFHVSWITRTMNAEVIMRANTDRELVATIKCRKLRGTRM